MIGEDEMETVFLHYRNLHRKPELSGQETETVRYMERELKALGYRPNRIGKTGVYADLTIDPDLPWVLLRADMDALAIQEKSCAPVQSENQGVMHACGHDAHSAMLLTAAQSLYGLQLPQNVRFLFQPAEETTTGATEMIQNGVIPENICACFAMHVWPGIPKGTIAVSSGKMMASSDVFRIHICGKKAHCAQQELGADALQTAVQIAAGLPEIRKYADDPQTILFCGSIHSGSSHNVVPDSADLFGTLRSFSAQDRKRIKDGITQLCEESTKKYNTSFELNWEGGCPAIHNDAALIYELQEIEPAVCDTLTPSMAAEDFSCYQDYAPGVMLWIGIGDVPPLHSDTFYVPEDILPEGVALWKKIAKHNWHMRKPE